MAYLDIDPKPMLRAIGLNRAPVVTSTYDQMIPYAVFGAGLIVGAGIALLLAPKSGRELRNDVSTRAYRLADTAREKMPQMKQQAKQMASAWTDNQT